jgi:SAM-dependent methyltransferase
MHDLIAAGSLDLTGLSRLTERPPLFAPHESAFWNDPHIARQMLAAHLDPSTDAASRRPETIDHIVDWLVGHLGLAPGQRVLDLGCGPGLYCSRLAEHGLDVTGVDFSESSLAYAEDRARERGLTIDYRRGNYLALPDVLGPGAAGRFDVALIIYYDFGVFSNVDRDAFLRGVRWALRPGGRFVFDVLTPGRRTPPNGQARFAVNPTGGFWKAGPHLELATTYLYPEASAELRQTVVVEPDGRATVYRVWDRGYTPDTIGTALAEGGFAVAGVFADLTGRPYADESESLAVVAV